MMVRFRFGREASSTAVAGAPDDSVRVMDRWSRAERETELASRTVGICMLRFAFGRGAGPLEFPTTRFAVAGGSLAETAVRSLGSDERTHPTDDRSANCAVSSGEASRLRDNFDA
jgi:hypothetical protein